MCQKGFEGGGMNDYSNQNGAKCTDKNECAANGGKGQCINGGVCSDSTTDFPTVGYGDYSCACPKGFTCKNCEVDQT